MFFTKQKQKNLDQRLERFDKSFKRLSSLLIRTGISRTSYSESVGGFDYYYTLDVTSKLSKLETKVDLLIDHLKLEYEPEHQCGPTLTKKKKRKK